MKNMRSFHIVALTLGLLAEASAVTLEEVQKHDSSLDCWSAIYGIVYDFNVYGPSHGKGGGPDSVWSLCGTDGTIPFDAVHGDSKEYLEVSSIIVIGDLTEETLPPVDPPPEEPGDEQEDEPEDEPEDPEDTGETTSAPDPTSEPTDSPLTPQPSVQTPEPTTSQPVETPGPSPARVTLEELAMHDTTDDCWVLFFDTVYNMTDYAYQHPGPGETVIHPYCGTNGTMAYAGAHPESLLLSVENEIIGPLEETTLAPVETPTPSPTPPPVETTAPSPFGVTLEELAMHDTADDCWVLFYDTVYDMTDYAYQHPGPGETVIHPYCGDNGTTAYMGVHQKGLLSKVEDEILGPLESTTNPTQPPVNSPSISFQELTTHDSPEDCWVAYYAVVYDMTGYAYIHPGPADAAIHPWCGKDGTNAFQFFHDESLLASVKNEYVGNLVSSSASRVKCIHAIAVAGVLAILFFV
jgi:cytochrome b involved in lipid metabolism